MSALNATFWIIQDAGFAKQEGLDTELVYIPSSPTVAQATLAGEIVISPANGQVIADVGLGGGDLVAMGAITNVVAFYIMATPEIKSINDLRGKVVGVTRFGASGDVGIRMFLTKYGLEPVKDVPLMQLGGLPEIAAAMSKKTVYAAAFSQPMAYVAQQAGAHVGQSRQGKYSLFARRHHHDAEVDQEHRPQAKAFVRAYGRAMHFMHTRKERRRRSSRNTPRSKIRACSTAAFIRLRLHREDSSGETGGFQVTLDHIAKKNPKAKQAKPEQFFDNSLVQELIDEGFFAKLWGKNP